MFDNMLYHLAMNNLIDKQRNKLKSSTMDLNTCLNKLHPLFNRLYKELLHGSCLINKFSNHFSFYVANTEKIPYAYTIILSPLMIYSTNTLLTYILLWLLWM